MNKIFIVIAVLGIGAAGVFIAFREPPQNIEEGKIIVEPNKMEQAPRSVTFPVHAQNDSGESGTIALTEMDGQTKVVLTLQGVPDDVLQPAHIHVGSCAAIGGVKYPLTNVSGVGTGPGGSETIIDVQLQDLLSQFPLAVNVHKSQQEAAIYVACGDILGVQDLQVGIGPEAKSGDVITVHYTGTLMDGTKFDSSLDAGKPFVFQLGAGRVIQGWDFGVVGMRVGGSRKLTIPSELAYGEKGAGGGVIPPDAVLIFEVSLLGIQGKE